LDNYAEVHDPLLAVTSMKGAKFAGLEDHTKSFGNLVEAKIESFNGMVTRKGGRQLIGWFKQSILGLVDGKLGSYIGAIAAFAFWFNRLRLGRGIKGVVLHMKTSQVLLMQSIGGDRVSDLTELKVRVNRSRSGLPRIIPVLHRRRIIAGDRTVIRFWNTLFGVYRVLEFPGILKTKTITDLASSVLSKERLLDVLDFIPIFWKAIFRLSVERKFKRVLKSAISAFPIAKSSPQTAAISDPENQISYISSSWEAVRRAAKVWTLATFDEVRDAFYGYLLGSGNVSFANILDEWGRKPYVEFVDISCLRTILSNRRKITYSEAIQLRKILLREDMVPEMVVKLKSGEFAPLISRGIEVTRINPKSHWMARSPKTFVLLTKLTTWNDQGAVTSTQILLHPDIGGWYLCDAVVSQVTIRRKKWQRLLKFDSLGKLGTKSEPAGKIRVFAMVDSWTQWALFPLHKAVQILLRAIVQDGTFDQVAPITRLITRWESGEIDRKSNVYSFDLSAATDRLPVSLQESILGEVLGPDLAANWRKLLVKRTYRLRNEDGKSIDLTYAVGQPMGALSSWVLLALTHHFIVQFAYYLVCRDKGVLWKWYSDYAILGDDMVVIGKSVAAKYLVIMRWLGVGIGLAKSIKAKKRLVLEFAKRFFVDSQDCSMVSLRDILVTTLSTAVSSEFMRKHDYSLNSYLSLRGLGYKSRGSVTGRLWSLGQRLRVYLVFLSYPGNVLGKESYTAWMSMTSINTVLPVDGMNWERVLNYLWNIWLTKYGKKIGYPDPVLQAERVVIINEEQQEAFSTISRWEDLPQDSRGWEAGDGWFHGKMPSGIVKNWQMRLYFWWWSIGSEYLGFIPSLPMVKVYRERRIIAPIASVSGLIDTEVLMDKRIMEIAAKTWWTQFNGVHEGIESKVEIVLKTSMYDPWLKRRTGRNKIPHTGLTYFEKSNFSNKIFVEFLWGLMTELDSTILFPKITMSTEMRTEELKYSTFLSLYNHWKSIQGNINHKPVGSPKRRKPKALAMQLWVKPSNELMIPVPEQTKLITLINLVSLKGKVSKGEILREHRGWTCGMWASLVETWTKISLFINSDIYRYLGYLVDCLVWVIILKSLNSFWDSLVNPNSSFEPVSPVIPEIPGEARGTSVSIGKAAIILGMILGSALLSLYMYDAYLVTLNYTDPAIKPLYLPAYAEIREVIPLGIGRTEIISMFEPKTLGTATPDLLTPTSPMHMHGFWE